MAVKEGVEMVEVRMEVGVVVLEAVLKALVALVDKEVVKATVAVQGAVRVGMVGTGAVGVEHSRVSMEVRSEAVVRVVPRVEVKVVAEMEVLAAAVEEVTEVKVGAWVVMVVRVVLAGMAETVDVMVDAMEAVPTAEAVVALVAMPAENEVVVAPVAVVVGQGAVQRSTLR